MDLNRLILYTIDLHLDCEWSKLKKLKSNYDLCKKDLKENIKWKMGYLFLCKVDEHKVMFKKDNNKISGINIENLYIFTEFLFLKQYYYELKKNLIVRNENKLILSSSKYIAQILILLKIAGIELTNYEIINFKKKKFSFLSISDIQENIQTRFKVNLFPKDITFILGMHRSGTSALTGLLCKRGLNGPKDSIKGDKNNLKGYFESKGILEINEKFLNSFQSNWLTIDNLDEEWIRLQVSSNWRKNIFEHIYKVFAKDKHIVVKDPRFCHLLKGILPCLNINNINLSIIIPVRHPAEVTASLQKAHGIFDTFICLNLWLTSIFESELISRGTNRKIVDFTKLINNTNQVINETENIVFQKCIGKSEKEKHSNFITNELVNNNYENIDLMNSLNSKEIKTLYEVCYKAYKLIISEEFESEKNIKEFDKFKAKSQILLK